MRILLSNDDGYLAPGLAQLAGSLEGLGEITVVAPEHAETGAEIAGRLLAPQASDPDVPLPHPDLATKSEAERPLAAPTVFGRREPGGGVLGLRVPIPVDRSGSGGSTRYGTPSDRPSGASTIR